MLPALHPEHLIAAMIPVVYLAMVAIERLGTGTRWPAVRGWQLTGVLFFMMLGVVNNFSAWILAGLFDQAWLFDARGLGPVAGALAGYVLLSLGNALLHRAYHRSDWLWRHVHQLHHAPPRLDVAGVMYQSPLEALANACLFSLVTVFILRLDPVAAMGCAFLGAFYGMFQHFNIHTPRWLGYFIQRPEAHCEHHRRGVHTANFSDLPIWDLLMGSFLNPRRFEGELGFEPAAARRVIAMLRGVDVNAGNRQSRHGPADAMPQSTRDGA